MNKKCIIETEVFDNKKLILHDIVDYDNNIVNNNTSEEKKREIEKLNEEFKDIVQKKNKLPNIYRYWDK